jgi:rRNA maturation endonuclease Nob1
MIIKNSTNINEKDIDLVEEFAKETGDKKTLSQVDKLVIAFGLTLSREKEEFEHVLTTPQKLEEFKPKSFNKYYADNQE